MTSRTGERTASRIARPVLGEDVRVAIYIRRSTDDETSPTPSKPRTSSSHDYVKSQPGWRIVARFHDDASGATTRPPRLQKALTAARLGAFDVLLVYRVDRFSRSLADPSPCSNELDHAGVVFRSATEPFDTSSPMGRMLLQLLACSPSSNATPSSTASSPAWNAKPPKANGTAARRPYGYQVDKTTQTLVADPRRGGDRARRSSTSTPATGSAPEPSPPSSTTEDTAPATADAGRRANVARSHQPRSTSAN